MPNYQNSQIDPGDKTIIGELVHYFAAQPAVKEAYFGFISYDNGNSCNLVLAVDHVGALDEIQKVSWEIKTSHFPDKTMFLAPRESRGESFELVKKNNFPFYSIDQMRSLEQEILKYWFYKPKYKEELIKTLKRTKIITLVKKMDRSSSEITFQSYIKGGTEFVPLFSDRKMLSLNPLGELPSSIDALEFIWVDLNNFLIKKLESQLFILNPGTPFEVEILGNQNTEIISRG